MTRNRKLVYDFYSLSYVSRLGIILKLGLATKEECDELPEQELWLKSFKTASEKDLVEDMIEEVAKHKEKWN